MEVGQWSEVAPNVKHTTRHVPSEGRYMEKHKRWRTPPPSFVDLVYHGSMRSTPAGVVFLFSRLLPHTTTLLLHLCSAVCRRKGPDMCVVQRPLLACSVASIRAFTPYLVINLLKPLISY